MTSSSSSRRPARPRSGRRSRRPRPRLGRRRVVGPLVVRVLPQQNLLGPSLMDPLQPSQVRHHEVLGEVPGQPGGKPCPSRLAPSPCEPSGAEEDLLHRARKRRLHMRLESLLQGLRHFLVSVGPGRKSIPAGWQRPKGLCTGGPILICLS